jgi:hypothetical protein
MGSARGGVYWRLVVTVSVPIAALLLARIPLPGLDWDILDRLFSNSRHSPTELGIFSLQLNPFIAAALLVEVLALLVPRWRPLRQGGYPERDRLWTAVKVVALLLVLYQAFFIVRWLRRTDDMFSGFGTILGPAHPLMNVAQILSVVGGAFALLWLTRVIDTWGAGNGFSVMIVAFMVTPMAESLYWAVRNQSQSDNRILVPLGLAAVAVAAVTRLAGGRPLRPREAPTAGDELPMPSSGLKPMITSVALWQFHNLLAKFGIQLFPDGLLPPETWTRRAIQAALTAGFCLLAAWLFNRPRAVEEAWRRAGVADADPARIKDLVRAAFARSLAWSLAICWGLMAAEWICADSRLTIRVVNLTVVACVVMDVVGELRFRYAHGAVAGVWPVHRLYTLPGLLKALESAGIPAFPRGRRHRTLWNFLAPFVPVDILVPVEHANRAEAILVPLAGSARSP